MKGVKVDREMYSKFEDAEEKSRNGEKREVHGKNFLGVEYTTLG